MKGNISFSIVIGILSAVAVFIILTRKATKELEKLNEKAQKALYSQNFDRALRIYESGLALGKKSPFIVGQIHGLIGMIHYMRKDNEKAKSSLLKSSSMNWVSKGMLGVIYMNEKKYDEMEKSFKIMVASGKKEGLAWSLYAYCLEKLNRREEALKILEEGNAKLKETDERIKSNILELKNNRKMRMKPFGDPWYQFMLERPPMKRMMQQQGIAGQTGYKKNALYKG
ncbi:MAG: tetratricopeptide repeat protein [Candidatus Delongbacteria bacterium]|nr:tetratricopeptide repeat protein [Candidatus Delongbacteria bacterium]MCG2760331.1 tetratricopeptide repeat protein [Candidatus Delongbacteria bacterium]